MGDRKAKSLNFFISFSSYSFSRCSCRMSAIRLNVIYSHSESQMGEASGPMRKARNYWHKWLWEVQSLLPWRAKNKTDQTCH